MSSLFSCVAMGVSCVEVFAYSSVCTSGEILVNKLNIASLCTYQTPKIHLNRSDNQFINPVGNVYYRGFYVYYQMYAIRSVYNKKIKK